MKRRESRHLRICKYFIGLNFIGLICWATPATAQALNGLAPATAPAPLVPAPVVAQAPTLLPIYGDAYASDWSDWSWAATNDAVTSATGLVHSGSEAISVDAGAYQALYLHHDGDIATAPYGNLTFWINGGPNGGGNGRQQLKVQVTLDGGAQTAYVLPPLAPNTWRQFSISLALLGVTDETNMDGFWIQNNTNAQAQTFYVDDIALVPPLAANIAVNAAAAIRPMDDRFAGVNLTADDSALGADASDTEQVLGAGGLDCRTVRIPGGSDSDRYHWETASLVDGTTGVPYGTGISVAQFAAVAEASGAQVIFTANYGSGTPNEAAALIAYANGSVSDNRPLGPDENGRDWGKISDWAALRAAAPLPVDDGRNVLRAAHPQPFGFRYVEIGNECWGTTWECDLHGSPYSHLSGTPFSPATYAGYAAQFMEHIRAVDPAVRVGVVATYDDQYNDWNQTMLSGLSTLGAYPDFVVQHWYPQGPAVDQESDAGLFATNAQWPTNADHLQAQIMDDLQPPSPVEMLVTENNSVYSDPGKQTVSITNGLYLADSIGHALQTAYDGLLVWDLRDGPNIDGNGFGPPDNDSALDGWRTINDPATDTQQFFGDYGLLRTYETDDDVTNAYYPSYYVLSMLTHFARGGDTIVTAASDDSLLSAYAALRSDGSLSLLLINTDESAQKVANIALAGFAPRGDATTYTYGYFQDRTEDSDSPFSRLVPPGVAQSTLTGVSSTFSYAIPPYSATVLSLAPITALATISTSPSSVTVGTTAAGTVTLTAPAPTDGEVVTLASSASSVVPASVTVPAGASSATFPVTAIPAIAASSATLTATLNGVRRSAALVINPVPGTSFPAGLQMFSVPMDYPGASLDTLLGYAGVTLYVWNQAAGMYDVTPAGSAGHLRLGQGYWAYFPKAVTLTSAGSLAATSSDFEIALAPGWNQVGNPFAAAVPLSSLEVQNGDSALPFTEASAIVAPIAFGYSPGANGPGSYVTVSGSQSIQPGQGYWMYAFQAATLLVPPPG